MASCNLSSFRLVERSVLLWCSGCRHTRSTKITFPPGPHTPMHTSATLPVHQCTKFYTTCVLLINPLKSCHCAGTLPPDMKNTHAPSQITPPPGPPQTTSLQTPSPPTPVPPAAHTRHYSTTACLAEIPPLLARLSHGPMRWLLCHPVSLGGRTWGDYRT